MNRIYCEVCQGNDLIKQDGVFLCQYCGCKFSLEEIKKQLVEITNPVQVVGVDNADTLYNRALDWLNLQNNAKAIAVLKGMVEKYPGDIRGWSKLARLTSDGTYSKTCFDNAVRLGDKALYDEWEAKAKAACEEVRNGKATVWTLGNARLLSFPCVQALLEEGEENAEFMKKLWDAIPPGNNGSQYSSLLKYLLAGDEKSYFDAAHIRIIIGKFIFFGSSYLVCNRVHTKSTIQQAFQDIEKLRAGKFKLCPYCGGKKFDKDSPWKKCRKCNQLLPLK